MCLEVILIFKQIVAFESVFPVNSAFIHICIFFNHRQIFTLCMVPLCMVPLFTGIAMYAIGLAVLIRDKNRTAKTSISEKQLFCVF